MKIIIAGGTGFIGGKVSRLLTEEGHSVFILSRHARPQTKSANPRIQLIQWDGGSQGPWAQECEGAEVIINLTGAPIADSRWTAKRKQELIDSRLKPTQALLQAIPGWDTKPHTFITASGIGFYGDSGTTPVDESSKCGEGFLPKLCRAWENMAQEGEAMGLRVLPVRFGMVLGLGGGALPKMSLPFKLFLGGPVLPGTQFVSWIHLEDLARLILFLITHQGMTGPVNAVAPEAVTMQDFCVALGKAMNRPSWFPVPEFVLRMALGELSTMLTTGQRVYPTKALQGGFSYTYPTLQPALNAIFGKSFKPVH